MPQTYEEVRAVNREATKRNYAKNRDARLAQRAERAAGIPIEIRRAEGARRVAEWRRENPVLRLLATARFRAKKQGIPFTITEADVVIPDVCPALGIPLVAGKGKPQDGSPSLDKINPSLGYVPGNVHVISYLANSIKYTASGQQILSVARFVLTLSQN